MLALQPFPDFVSQAEGSAQPPIHLTNTSTQDNYAMLYSGHFCPPFLCPVLLPLNTMTFEDMFISSYWWDWWQVRTAALVVIVCQKLNAKLVSKWIPRWKLAADEQAYQFITGRGDNMSQHSTPWSQGIAQGHQPGHFCKPLLLFQAGTLIRVI